MSAEERWNDRKFAESEPTIEIKNRTSADPREDLACQAPKCGAVATVTYEVGAIGQSIGTEFPFCEDHDSEENAFEAYRRDTEAMRDDANDSKEDR